MQKLNPNISVSLCVATIFQTARGYVRFKMRKCSSTKAPMKEQWDQSCKNFRYVDIWHQSLSQNAYLGLLCSPLVCPNHFQTSSWVWQKTTALPSFNHVQGNRLSICSEWVKCYKTKPQWETPDHTLQCFYWDWHNPNYKWKSTPPSHKSLEIREPVHL